MVDRSTIQRDAQLSYKLAPQGNDWLNADAKIYWSEVRINAQNTGSSGEYREQITKGARLENRFHSICRQFRFSLTDIWR